MKHLGHIDVITKYFYPVTAGIETNILETYSELARLGWHVTVHTTASTLDGRGQLPRNDTVRGIDVVRYPPGIFRYVPAIRFSTSGLICLHNFNMFPHLYLYGIVLLRRIFGLRTPNIILTPHGGFTPEWPTFPPLVRFIKRAYHKRIGLWLIRNLTSAVRAISPWEKQAMIGEGVDPKKITLIGNGLDITATRNHELLATQRIKTRVRSLGRYLVAVGRIAPIKNYETAIDALAMMPRTVTLVIIGPVQDNAYLMRLKAKASALGISQRVLFWGTLRGSDKYYVVKKAFCQIHLARWESFCNVIYEAKSLGQICVVADNTALTSQITNGVNGFVTDTYDATKLADILNHILENKTHVKLRNMRRALARETYPTWNVTAQAMHIIYKRFAIPQ